MEQRIGVARLTPVDGAAGRASFPAADDDAALVHIEQHFIDRLKGCIRAELSSMRIVVDPATPGGTRFLDDSHSNPSFHDSYVKFNAVTRSVEVEFESTRTALLSELPGLQGFPRAGAR